MNLVDEVLEGAKGEDRQKNFIARVRDVRPGHDVFLSELVSDPQNGQT